MDHQRTPRLKLHISPTRLVGYGPFVKGRYVSVATLTSERFTTGNPGNEVWPNTHSGDPTHIRTSGYQRPLWATGSNSTSTAIFTSAYNTPRHPREYLRPRPRTSAPNATTPRGTPSPSILLPLRPRRHLNPHPPRPPRPRLFPRHLAHHRA